MRQETIDELNREFARLDAEDEKLKEIRVNLENELRKQRELDDSYNLLIQRFNQVRDEIEDAHKNDNPEDKRERIEEIQLRLQPLLEEVNALEHTSNVQPLVYVKSADPHTSIDALKANMEDLQRVVDTDQKEASRYLQLSKLGELIRQQFAQFMDGLKSAEQILKGEKLNADLYYLVISDPNADISQLQRSLELLQSAQPQLESVSKIYDENLESEDVQTQELRNKTADQLAKLKELFNNNNQSAKDRIDKIYVEHQNELAQLVNEAQNVLINPKTMPADFDEYSARLLSSIEDAENITQPIQSTSSDKIDPQLEKLNSLIEMARQANKAIDNKMDLWKRFKALCEQVGNKQDQSQQIYDQVKNEGLRSVENLESSVEHLNVSKFMGLKLFKKKYFVS